MPTETGLAIVSMVQDEADVIEAFVRHNLAQADHLFVVDSGSVDGTLQILVELVNEGLPLTVQTCDPAHFQQGIVINTLARQVAPSGRYRWFLPLDADEFIRPASRPISQLLMEEVGTDAVGIVSWANFVPLAEWHPEPDGDLRAAFVGSAPVDAAISKVVVPAALVPSGLISEGNHMFRHETRAITTVPTSLVLQHLPVRSSSQITAKALLGSARLKIKPGRGPGEGVHWDSIADFVRGGHYSVSLSDLRRLAADYPRLSPHNDFFNRPNRLLFEGPPVKLKYSHLVRSGLAARLDRHIGRLNAMLTAAVA